MASLKWLVHSACHVLGYPTKEETGVFHGEALKMQNDNKTVVSSRKTTSFQMPLHYPRYTKSDYETMEEWRIDALLAQYGLGACTGGGVDTKREYAKGAFLWPDQY